jgi:hypothetical protein
VDKITWHRTGATRVFLTAAQLELLSVDLLAKNLAGGGNEQQRKNKKLQIPKKY